MDDLTLLKPFKEKARKAFGRLEQLVSWCRMRFKPTKSRSLTIKKGKIDDRTRYTVWKDIPTITDAPCQESCKSLGRWFTKELSDKKRAGEVHLMVEDGLRRLTKLFMIVVARLETSVSG